MLISLIREPTRRGMVWLSKMQRYIPIAVVLVTLIALSAYFGPPLYRGFLFRRDCRQMLADAQAGKLPNVIASIEAQQRQEMGDLLTRYIPQDFNQSIKSLRLSRYEETDPGKIWAYVIVKIDQGGGMGIYEGRLHWLFDGKRWYWDFGGSYGAAFSPGGDEQTWNKLGDLAALAGQL
jgi:hypothetical protein